MRIAFGFLTVFAVTACGAVADEPVRVSELSSASVPQAPAARPVPAPPMAGWPLAIGSTTHQMQFDGDKLNHSNNSYSYSYKSFTRYADGSGGVISLTNQTTGGVQLARSIARGVVTRPTGQVDKRFRPDTDRSSVALDFELPATTTTTKAGTLILELDADLTARARLILAGEVTDDDWIDAVPVATLLCIDDTDCAREGLGASYVCGPEQTCVPSTSTLPPPR
jgi:hypothetical protein